MTASTIARPPRATAVKAPGWLELLSLALIVTIASHAVPFWMCGYVLPWWQSKPFWLGIRPANWWMYLDYVALAFGLILALPTPRRSGLRVGSLRRHWWKVLIVVAVPIALTAIVYPRLAVRPFAGASASMWLVSPLAQDLVFVGFIYGLFAQRGEKPFRPWLPINTPILVGALFFTAWHLPNFLAMPAGYVWFQLVYVFVGALWTGATRLWTGSMLYITIVHMAANCIAWASS